MRVATASAGSFSWVMRKLRSRRSPASACGRWTPAWCSYRWRGRSSTPNGWRARALNPGTVHPPRRRGSWLLLADNASGADTETAALVAEFTSRFGSSSRRVISAELSDESAVREAFAKATSDSEPSPVGVIVFVGKPSFDGADSEGALRRARELIWSIRSQGAPLSTARRGRIRGCGWLPATVLR